MPYLSLFKKLTFCDGITGLLWACWLGRWSKSHHTLIKLIAGASLFLLVLAFTPQPDPSFTRIPLYGVRRIQQEIDDYTAPKPYSKVLVKDVQLRSLVSVGQDTSGMREDHGSYSLPLLPRPQSPSNFSQVSVP